MPQMLTRDTSFYAVKESLEEPWKDVTLYMPLKVEQVLTYDWASCISVQTYLNMCKLKYKTEERSNAEHMSPNGKVPFIHSGSFVIAELESIVKFLEKKKISLTDHFSNSDKNDMRAYISLVFNVLNYGMMFLLWTDEKILEITKQRYGSVYPWPLDKILTYQKRNNVIKKLKFVKIWEKKIEDVYSDIDNCCKALSDRLDKKPYFFGDNPTELDAVVFGHLYVMMTCNLPDERLASIVKQYDNLCQFCKVIEDQFFTNFVSENGSSTASSDEYVKV